MKSFSISAQSKQRLDLEAEDDSDVILVKISPDQGESAPVPVKTSLAAFEQQFIEIRWPDPEQTLRPA